MHTCNLCGESDLLPLIDFGMHPVAKHYLTNEIDHSPTWPVKLFFCESCGLSQLVDSVPPEVLYDNYITLSSWKFQPHIQHEVEIIQSLEGINLDANIIEIGSNDGLFLHHLALSGYKNILGVEPAKDAYDLSIGKGIKTVQEFLTPELSKDLFKKHNGFDLFVSRQNLEHMSDLKDVVESIRILVKPNGYVLIEVPNYACNLRMHDYTLWEEHVNYFTVDTLRYLLSMAGVELIHDEVILFSGEAIFVIGRKVENVSCSTDFITSLRKQNIKYKEDWAVFRQSTEKFLQQQKMKGKKIAVYGAGSRAFCYINYSDIASCIDIIVDDQPEKQNLFMPGGRIPIIPSEALYSEGIDICLLAVNAEIEDKVINKHTKWIENGGLFWSILPPSNRLLPVWESFYCQ